MEKAKIMIMLDEEANNVNVHMSGFISAMGLFSVFSSFTSVIYDELTKQGIKQKDAIDVMTSIVQNISELEGEDYEA